MVENLNTALGNYFESWEQLCSQRADAAFFDDLLPVAVGWKVADTAEYQEKYAELRGQCDRIVETWMNGRWIAKMHLREGTLTGGITVIKLMQRRPEADDALGLDHVDFYSPKVKDADAVLAGEPDLSWTHESNDVVADYDWISVWFNGTEAKLKSSTVIDIVVKELLEIKEAIIADRKS